MGLSSVAEMTQYRLNRNEHIKAFTLPVKMEQPYHVEKDDSSRAGIVQRWRDYVSSFAQLIASKYYGIGGCYVKVHDCVVDATRMTVFFHGTVDDRALKGNNGVVDEGNDEMLCDALTDFFCSTEVQFAPYSVDDLNQLFEEERTTTMEMNSSKDKLKVNHGQAGDPATLFQRMVSDRKGGRVEIKGQPHAVEMTNVGAKVARFELFRIVNDDKAVRDFVQDEAVRDFVQAYVSKGRKSTD